MRTHTGVRWIAVVGTATLLLTACSGDKSDGSDVDASRVTIGSLMGAPDYENIDYDAQQQQIEEAVAECMTAEGWEYIPVQYPDSGTAVTYTDEDEVERIKREGLGITYYLLNEDVGYLEDDPWVDFVDPNTDYVESLSESEMTAYYGSLYGTEEEQAAATITEIDPETGEEYTTMEGNLGCQGEAYDAVVGEEVTQTPEYYEAIQGYYEELQVRVEADPGMIAVTESWSTCMSDEGYDYEDPDSYYEAIYTDLQGRADAVLGDDYYKDPMDGWTTEQMDDFWATASEEDIDALYATTSSLTDDQRAQLEVIFAEEVKVGLAANTCFTDLSEKAMAIYADLEEQYALEHEDELRALAASLGSGK